MLADEKHVTIDRAWTANQLQSNLRQVLSPTVCFRIHHLLSQGTADYSDIADLAMADPYLSAKILGMANIAQGSGGAGGAGKPPILSLQRALQILGTRHTQMLVMSVMLAGPLLECPAWQANVDLRRWVLALGAAGEWLGRQGGAASRTGAVASGGGEDSLMASLMLGLGVLILHAGLGSDYDHLLGQPPHILDLRDREFGTWKVTHDEVTLWALEAMNCPPELASWFDDPADHQGVLRRRSIEAVAAVAAGLDRDGADPWLADGLPRLGIDPALIFGPDLPKLRARVLELAQVFAVDIGTLELEDHPVPLLRQAAVTVEALLADKLASSEAAGAALQHETIAAIAEQVATRHADADPLTGVSNRRGLEQWLRELRDQPSVMGLILVDIDLFKAINDTWGHAGGDQVLVWVARALQEAQPRPLLVARLGGDEFVGVYPTRNIDQLRQLTHRILAKVAAARQGDRPRVTLSIGGLVSPGTSLFHSWRDCCSQADALLYEAKRAGRNGAVLAEVPGAGAAD